MGLAAKEAARSNCMQVYWGAIIVSRAGSIIGRGHTEVNSDDMFRFCTPSCIRKDIRSCTQTELCGSTHAETNAVEDALAQGNRILLQGSVMFLYGYKEDPIKPIVMRYYPCMPCAKVMAKYKIDRLWFVQPTADPRNERELMWLPYDLSQRDKKYLPGFIQTPQFTWNAGHYLGLEGHDIEDVDTESKEKLWDV